jgi:hypothetical protein
MITIDKTHIPALTRQVKIALRCAFPVVLVCTSDGRLTVNVCTGSLLLEHTIPVKTDDQAHLRVWASDWAAVLKAAKDTKAATITLANSGELPAKLLVTTGAIRRSLDFAPIPEDPDDQYPELGPIIGLEPTCWATDSRQFRRLWEAVGPFVSRDECRVNLCQVLVMHAGEAVRWVATDGHRMTIHGPSAEALPLKGPSFTLPADVAKIESQRTGAACARLRGDRRST